MVRGACLKSALDLHRVLGTRTRGDNIQSRFSNGLFSLEATAWQGTGGEGEQAEKMFYPSAWSFLLLPVPTEKRSALCGPQTDGSEGGGEISSGILLSVFNACSFTRHLGLFRVCGRFASFPRQ